jgi:hypothetical protein
MTSQGKGAEGTPHFFTGSEEQVLRGLADMKKQYTSPDAKRYATTMAALTPLIMAASTEMRAGDNEAAYEIAKGMTSAFIGAALNVLFNVYSTEDAVGIFERAANQQLPAFIEHESRRQA